MSPKKTGRSSGTDGRRPDDEIEEKLKTYEKRLARLFAELSEIGSRVGGPAAIKEPAPDRVELDSRRQAIGAEIRKVRRKMNELRQRTGKWYRRGDAKTDSAVDQSRREEEEEILCLRRRLSEIANAQVALANEWNKDPTEAKRADFEKEYRRLATQYSKVRAELNHKRSRLRDLKHSRNQ